MTAANEKSSCEAELESGFSELINAIATQAESNGSFETGKLVERFPQFESQIRSLLPAVRMLSNTPPKPAKSRPVILEKIGDFRLVREIGRGGMGVVYEAVQARLGRRVALKMLPAASVLDPRALRRFRHEAAAAGQLDHPNIVPVYSTEFELGIHFFSMKLIPGVNLSQVISDLKNGRQRINSDGLLDAGATQEFSKPGSSSGSVSSQMATKYFNECARLVADVADGLHYAHKNGVIHRDVKPANLLLDYEGRIWITDFGLAQVKGSPDLSTTSGLLGTIRYMSPEQVNSSEVIDHRSDIYSLGATLYELMTLQATHTCDTHNELIQSVSNHSLKAPRKIDPRIPCDLETIVMKALAKDPADRYRTADEFRNDLRLFQERRPVKASRPGILKRLSLWASRNYRVVSAISVVLVFLAAMWGVMVNRELSNAHKTAEIEQAMRLAAQASASLNTDPVMALELAQQSYEKRESPEARSAILAALDKHYDYVSIPIGHGSKVSELECNLQGTKCFIEQQTTHGPRVSGVCDLMTERFIPFETAPHSAVWLPDGETYVGLKQNPASNKRTLYVQAIHANQPVFERELNADANLQGVSNDSSFVICQRPNELIVHRVDNGEPVATYSDSEAIQAACFVDKKNVVVVARHDGSFTAWDFIADKTLWETSPAESDQSDLKIQMLPSRGDKFFVVKQGRVAWLYGTEDGSLLKEFGNVSKIALHPEGGQIAVQNDSRTDVLDTHDFRVSRTIRSINPAYSPSGSHIAFCHLPGKIFVYSTKDLAELHTVKVPNIGLQSAVYLHDCKKVVVTGAENSVRIYNALSGRDASIVSSQLGPASIVRVSEDSKSIFVADQPAISTAVFDVLNPNRNYRIEGRVKSARGVKKRFVTIGSNLIEAYDVATGKLINSYVREEQIDRTTISDDGRFVVLVDQDQLMIWNVDTGVVRRIRQQTEVIDVRFQPLTSRFAVLYATGRIEHRVAPSCKIDTVYQVGSATSQQFSLDGSHFAAAGPNKVSIFASGDTEPVQVFRLEDQPHSCCFDSNSGWFGLVSKSGCSHWTMQTLNFKTGATGPRITASDSNRFEFHPYKPLVLASTKQGLQVWDLAKETENTIAEGQSIFGVYTENGQSILHYKVELKDRRPQWSVKQLDGETFAEKADLTAQVGLLIGPVSNVSLNGNHLYVVSSHYSATVKPRLDLAAPRHVSSRDHAAISRLPIKDAVVTSEFSVATDGIDLQVKRLGSSEPTENVDGLTGRVTRLVNLPQQDGIAVCFCNGRVELLNPETGELTDLNHPQHNGAIRDAQLSVDQKWFSTFGDDHRIFQTDLKSGQTRDFTIPETIFLAFRDNGIGFAIVPASHQDQVWLYHESETDVDKFPAISHVTAIGFLKSGLLAASAEREAMFWNVDTRTRVATFSVPASAAGVIFTFLDRTNHFVTSSVSATSPLVLNSTLWEVKDTSPVKVYDYSGPEAFSRSLVVRDQGFLVRSPVGCRFLPLHPGE